MVVSPGNGVAGGSINRNLGSMILEIKTNSKARRKIMLTVPAASRMTRTQQWFILPELTESPPVGY